jgi:hypothetical protein
MGYEDKRILGNKQFESNNLNLSNSRTIFYGEVITVDSNTGNIQARIQDLDTQIANEDLSFCYPMFPKHFFIFPLVGEIVRISLEDVNFPQRSRYYQGPVISQMQNIAYDSYYTALSTTNLGVLAPATDPASLPNAAGVFPNIEDVAVVGRLNCDIILRDNDMELRAGRSIASDILTLNIQNPASIRSTYEQEQDTENYVSTHVIMADRIALISHTGDPKFPAYGLTIDDRNNIFETGHPLGRGDITVEVFEAFRKALLTHIHPGSGLAPDPSGDIAKLMSIDFTKIEQPNIVIN